MAAKNWCFTIHDKEDNWPSDTMPIALWDPDVMKFLVYQLEKAPTTGKLHVQGYVQLKKKARMSTVKGILHHDDAHLETSKGTPRQNLSYCTKADTRLLGPWEFGEKPTGQGARNDLLEVAKEIKEGKTKREVAEAHPAEVIKFSKGLEIYRHTIDSCPRWRNVEVTYIWGPTGTGKTRSVWESVEDVTQIYKVESDGQWWDGYDSQDIILFDDYNSQVPIHKWLTWLDGHPLQVPIKGAYVYAKWTKVFITSNVNPERLYMKHHAGIPGGATGDWDEDVLKAEHREALMRRLTTIREMTGDT